MLEALPIDPSSKSLYDTCIVDTCTLLMNSPNIAVSDLPDGRAPAPIGWDAPASQPPISGPGRTAVTFIVSRQVSWGTLSSRASRVERLSWPAGSAPVQPAKTLSPLRGPQRP